MNVGIFRLQLFKSSETFIRNQCIHLQKYKPVFIGRRLLGDPKGSSFIAPKSPETSLFSLIQHLNILILRSPGFFTDLLNNTKLNLIHAHFGVDAVVAMRLAKRLKVPLVVTLHGMDVTRLDYDMLKSCSPNLINYVFFKKSLFKRADLFICVSEFIKQAAVKAGFPEDKLKVHYIGIDCDSLSMRNSLGEDGLIVHVGRLVEKKGTKYLLEAFAKVREQITNAKLVIIGDGPLKESLQLQSERLGIKNDVMFLGMQPNNVVVDWVKKAALMAVPSITAANGDSEGLPTVIAEANALGVPVVGYDSAGIKEILLHEKTGLMSPERDIGGLAKNLSLLLSDSKLRFEMGVNARRNVEENFNIKKQSEKLELIYDNLIKDCKTANSNI